MHAHSRQLNKQLTATRIIQLYHMHEPKFMTTLIYSALIVRPPLGLSTHLAYNLNYQQTLIIHIPVTYTFYRAEPH